MIRVIAVGPKHDKDLAGAIERYTARLRPPYDIEWVLLPYAKQIGDVARDDETKRILAKIKPDETVILLDERGMGITSPQLARALDVGFGQGKKVAVVIGGAYGVGPELHRRASYVLAVSKFVLPHQIVRLLVAEQIYRSQEISAGRPYHHE